MPDDRRIAPVEITTSDESLSLWLTLLLSAAAGGMGWGIRGQYGHETGAMLAGVLVALVIGLLFCRRQSSLFTARMVALTAVGISFGGSETYGQTVGLTHDAELVGNWAALRWGMFGLFIKGGIWIGFAGVMMGAGLGGKRYRALEVLLLFVLLIQLYFLGLWLLNETFDPESRQLPRVYFSDDWHWEPDKVELSPRPEVWGGLLLALAGLWAYVTVWKRDAMARNLGLFGVLFGGIGFSLGQAVQAYHAWNTEWFQQGWFAPIEAYMNWWNTMETLFGAILGLGLGLGVWLNRRKLPPPAEDTVELVTAAEIVLLAGHVAALAAWNFMSFDSLDRVADHALTMGLVPLALTVGGRYAPYLIALPIVAMPICGKTLREMSYEHAEITALYGWAFLFVVPLILLTVAAVALALRGKHGQDGQSFARWSLLIASWLYYGLTFAFFRFPWPWEAPTSRSPSAIVFAACLLLLTLASVFYARTDRRRTALAKQAATATTS
ncbi:MAG TPA: hypothetical protein VGK58_09705 [Lacipirellulaceae bacterium]